MVLRSVIALSCVLLVGVPPALATRGQQKKAKVVDKKKTGKKKNKTATNGDGLVASRAKPGGPAQRVRPRVAATDSAPTAVTAAQPLQQPGYVRPRRGGGIKALIVIAAVVGVSFLGFLGFSAFKFGQAADSVRDSQVKMEQMHEQFKNDPWGSFPGGSQGGPPPGWPSNGPGSGSGFEQPTFEEMQEKLDDMMGRGDKPPSK
jgi:hypothetical protein